MSAVARTLSGSTLAAPATTLQVTPCQRLQERFPAVPWQRPLANADTRQVSACHCVLAPAHTCPPSACHCEERGSRPATWQSVLLAVGQNEKQYFGQIRKSCKFAMAARSCTRRHPASFCMSLRGAKRRGNPLLLRQYITKSNTLGEYEKHCEFARTAVSLPGISAGTRIATPVCALVRNDMLKTATRLRL